MCNTLIQLWLLLQLRIHVLARFLALAVLIQLTRLCMLSVYFLDAWDNAD